MMKKLLTLVDYFSAMPRAAVVIAAASLGTLAFVFTLQFGFGYDPCVLCIWQRFPFGFAAFFALLAFFLKPYNQRSTFLLGLITVCFAVGAGLAVFHTGVEQHWWLGTDGCHVQPLTATSVEDLRTKLLGTLTAHCDEISWTFLGLSMTNWNLPFSLGLTWFSAHATQRSLKRSI